MKHICTIATTLTDYQVLSPLADLFHQDPDITLTQISSDGHRDPHMAVLTVKLEENGFTLTDESKVYFKGSPGYFRNPAAFLQDHAERFFQASRPDMVVLTGSSPQALQAAVTAGLHQIPIAHIHGGETGYGTWDHSYGYGITKLGHLHFTATEAFRQQVIRFGESEDTVFNTGSLLMEKANTVSLVDRSTFNRRLRFEPGDRFILADLHPVASLGSKNEQRLSRVLNALERFGNRRKIVFIRPGNSGIGNIMTEMVHAFLKRYKGNAVLCPESSDLAQLTAAVAHCDLLISNHSRSLVLAAGKKKPAVHVRSPGDSRLRTLNQIDVDAEPGQILTALDTAVSCRFQKSLSRMISPYEQSFTAEKIKQRIRDFTPEQIRPKAAYPGDDTTEKFLFYKGEDHIVN